MPLSTSQYGFIIDPMVPFTDASGTTIRNGYVRVFVAGSSTPVITYKNYDGATNEETIQLDNSGRTAYPVIVSKGNTYKVCVYDAEHSQESPILTIDKVVPAGANVEATNIVTGLDNVESPEAGWVKSTVSGTDAEVSLDATNVTSEVDTMVKATAASADYMMPLVHKTGSDPDKKITLGNIFKFVLNFIHSLTDTAAESDLVSGNYLALDGSAGTKKLPGNCIAPKSVQDKLVVDSAGTKSNNEVENSVFEPFTVFSGGYINLGAVDVGNLVDLTPVSNVDQKYCIENCGPGDMFLVTGKGGNLSRLYGFIDASDKLLYKSEARITVSGLFVVAPENTAKVIFNVVTTSDYEILRKKKLENIVGEYDETLYSSSGDFFINGGLNSSGALSSLSATRLVTPKFIEASDFISVSPSAGYKASVYAYDSSKNYLGNTGFKTTSISKSDAINLYANAKYLRVYFGRTDDGSITIYEQENANMLTKSASSAMLSACPLLKVSSSVGNRYWRRSVTNTGALGTSANATRKISELFPIVGDEVITTSLMTYSIYLYSDCEGKNLLYSSGYGTSATSIATLLTTYTTAKYYRLLLRYNDATLGGNSQDLVNAENLNLKKHYVCFERGSIDADDGFFVAASSQANNETNFNGKWRTSLYMKVNGLTFKFSRVSCPSSIRLYEFDGAKSYIGYRDITTNSVQLNKSTCFVKLSVSSTDAPVLYILSSFEISEEKNEKYIQYKPVLYEVSAAVKKNVTESDSSISLYDSNHYFNSLSFALPPNYSENGKKVPLIIWCHGSGGYPRNQSTFSSYESCFDYLLKEGFALLGCFGASTKVYTGDSNFDDSGNPDNIACVVDAYRWFTKNYNVSSENVYVLSKSHGGMISLALAYNKTIPVKAVAALCPGLQWFTNQNYLGEYSDQIAKIKAIAADCGFHDVGALDEDALDTPYSTDANSYVLGNADNLVATMPYLMGFNGELAESLLTSSLAKDYANSVFKSPRIMPTPYKVWYAEDDTVVVAQYIKSLVESVNKGVGIAEIRRMPDGTGQHHSVDTDEDALKVPSIVTALGETCTDVPLAYAELVQWFRRFC